MVRLVKVSSITADRRQAALDEARRLVRQRYREPDLLLTDIASAVGVSPRQLQRLFREIGDEDFRGYLLRVRMERARELLTRPKNPLPVHIVARRVGYRQASGLRQGFKRHFGVTPSEVQPPPTKYLGTMDEPIDD